MRDPPLYLEVSAPTREVLDRALEAIDAVIDNPNMPILDADLHGVLFLYLVWSFLESSGWNQAC